MVSGGGRILGIIKLIIEYDILIVSGTVLRARTEMITERPDSNLVIIFKDRVLSSELSDVLKYFRNMIVNNNNVKELQLKKRKCNKYYYTKNITHGF